MVPISDRTFNVAVRVVNLCKVLDEIPGVSRTLGRQLIRSGTSVGANVEGAQAGQSTADFIHKMTITLKEARETQYWLRLLIATELLPKDRLMPILKEAEEITKIIGAIIVKAKRNKAQGANSKL